MVVVFGLGMLIIPVLGQEVPAGSTEDVAAAGATPAAVEPATQESPSVTTDAVAPVDAPVKTEEAVPSETPETKTESTPEQTVETPVVAEEVAKDAQAVSTSEPPVASTPEGGAAPVAETTPAAVPDKTAEDLPAVTPETKPENAPEQKTETASPATLTSEAAAPVAASTDPVQQDPATTTTDTATTQTSEAQELIGIDTVNVDEPAGNWLYKRLYWERAEDKYQKIKELMGVIFEARTKFFEQRVKLDKDIFDPIYTLGSFRQGELSGILKELLEDIDKKGKQKNEMDESARVLFAKVEANKERLEEVKKEIEFIGKIDNAVDEAITTLVGLLNQGRNFEMQAWGDFKAISRELSDKKARDFFYRIDTYWRNIKDIEVYVTTKLTEHMDYLAKSAQQHADGIKGLLKELEDQGFVLKEQINALEKSKNENVANADKEDEAALKAKKEKGGFFATISKPFSWIVQPIIALGRALWRTILVPFNYFFGEKKVIQPASLPAVPESKAPETPGAEQLEVASAGSDFEKTVTGDNVNVGQESVAGAEVKEEGSVSLEQ